MSNKITSDDSFRPNSYHFNEYNFQRMYAEEILQAPWHLTLDEWCNFFLKREKLRDCPPVTTGYWLTRKNSYQPYNIDNVQMGTKGPERGRPLTENYRLVQGEWKLYRRTRH